jgi:hypothetical protein
MYLSGPCHKKATRRTPNGFYCEDHFAKHSRSGAVGYAFTLDWYRPTHVANLNR